MFAFKKYCDLEPGLEIIQGHWNDTYSSIDRIRVHIHILSNFGASWHRFWDRARYHGASWRRGSQLHLLIC